MEAHIQLGTREEAFFELVDEDGNPLIPAEKLNNAVLKVTPTFYAGQKIQTWGRNATKGGKGRIVKQFLRLSADTGKHKADDCDVKPKKVAAKFDSLDPLKES